MEAEFFKKGRRNGVMDNTPDCCTIRGAVAGFESLAFRGFVLDDWICAIIGCS